MPVSAASSCRVTRFSLALLGLLFRACGPSSAPPAFSLPHSWLGCFSSALGRGLLLRLLGLGSGLLVLNGGLLGAGGLLLGAAGKVSIQASLGILAGQGLQQQVQFLFTKGAAGLVASPVMAVTVSITFLVGTPNSLATSAILYLKSIYCGPPLSGKMFCAQLRKVFVGQCRTRRRVSG